MIKQWTKADYLWWLENRSDNPADWSRAACVAADALIRKTAIENFIQHVDFGDCNKLVVAFAIDMVKNHFGSAEVDELLTKLRCYPEWL